jgi:hypothetical protein
MSRGGSTVVPWGGVERVEFPQLHACSRSPIVVESFRLTCQQARAEKWSNARSTLKRVALDAAKLEAAREAETKTESHARADSSN